MNKSESIKELAGALSKAQGAMTAAKMDSVNPFFKSKYADLGSVIQASKSTLAANGLRRCRRLPNFCPVWAISCVPTVPSVPFLLREC